MDSDPIFPRRQRGVALVLIVVLLVIFVLIGGFMATRSGVQHASVAFSVRAMQAWFAARSGLDWAIHEATTSVVAHDAICDAPPPAVAPFTLAGGAANGYVIQVSCDDGGGYTEGGRTFEVDIITVTAARGNPGDIGYASRSVQAVISTGETLPP